MKLNELENGLKVSYEGKEYQVSIEEQKKDISSTKSGKMFSITGEIMLLGFGKVLRFSANDKEFLSKLNHVSMV